MTDRSHNEVALGLGIGLLGGLMAPLLAGCGEDPPPPPPLVVNSGPAKPPTPSWQEVAAIEPLDPKVEVQSAQFQNTTEEQMVAVYKLLNAFASGEADNVRPLVDTSAKLVLDELVDDGGWRRSMASISSVQLESAVNRSGEVEANILFESDTPGSDVSLTWVGKQRGDMFVFAAAPDMPTDAAGASTDSGAEGETGEEEGGDDGVNTPRDENERRPNDPRRFVPKEREIPDVG